MKYALILLLAILLGLVVNTLLLPILRKLKVKQEILLYLTEHYGKSGTPTMGGLSFLFSLLLCLPFIMPSWSVGHFAILIIVAYGIVGLLDDYIKIRFGKNLGLRSYQKFFLQGAVAVIIAIYTNRQALLGGVLNIPFCDAQVDIGAWVIPLIVFVFLAVTNGVNLTDGLDGLATGTTICCLSSFCVLIALQISNAQSLGNALEVKELSSMLVLGVVLIGALIAFLVFNCHPAKVFMGDTGSLALGAAVACIGIFTNNTLYIPLFGIVYVVSCLSVILQVGYFKATKGKRILTMAPLHHHLQHNGLSETRITVLYSVVTLVVALAVLCSTLLR